MIRAQGTGFMEVLHLEQQQAEGDATFTTYNFEVAEDHTYFVGEAGIWVHNQGLAHCQKIYSLYKRFRDKASSTESPFETLLRMKERVQAGGGISGISPNKKVPGAVWRMAAKDVNDEMFALAARGDIPLSKIPSYSDWKLNFSPGLGGHPIPGDYHIHHSVETWIQRDKLGITGDFNSVPGFLIDGKSHTPQVGSLAHRLGVEIRPLSDPLQVTTKMRDIYLSEGLGDLWGVTKKWLQSKNIPIPP